MAGLVSDGGVHSSMEHLLDLCALLQRENLDDRVFIHAFLDGRDTDPHSGAGFMSRVLEDKRLGRARIATVIGRYYAMDRDKRWERVKKAYDLMTSGEGKSITNAVEAIKEEYAKGITDEFMEPLVADKNGLIEEGDTVLCFNFRTDRGREITMALSQQDFPEFGMHKLPLHYYTLTEYDKTFKQVGVLFHNHDLEMTLGEYLSEHGLTQIRAAETEKYPHVTFFFSGGREEPFSGETRILIPSPKVATYDLQPQMSAPELTSAILEKLETTSTDFYCINFANPDMVGHTGVFNAIKQACETVDDCARRICEKALEKDYRIVIIADHGNADKAVNDDGTPNTAHSTNPVPCFVLGENDITLHHGILADVAPTILKLMHLPIPPQMEGKPLY